MPIAALIFLAFVGGLILLIFRFQSRKQQRVTAIKRHAEEQTKIANQREKSAVIYPEGGAKRLVGYRTRLILQESGRYEGKTFLTLQKIFLDQAGDSHYSIIEAILFPTEEKEQHALILATEKRARRLSLELNPNPHQPTGPLGNHRYLGAKFDTKDVSPKTEEQKQVARAFTYKIYTFYHSFRNDKTGEEFSIPVLQIANRNENEVMILDDDQAKKVIIILESHQRLQHLSLSTPQEVTRSIENQTLDSYFTTQEKAFLSDLMPKQPETPANGSTPSKNPTP